MATFTYMGDTYPKDSKYAKTMATYMAPPKGEYASELTVSQWNQARDWAKSRSLTLDEMEAVLRGTDYIGTPRSLGGWDDLAQRLNIDTTRKPKKTPKKRRAPKAKNWIQKADKEIEKDKTEGALTRQAKARGWKSPLAFARAVVRGWDKAKKSGKPATVLNKKTGKQSEIDTQLWRRANFAVNVQPKNGKAKKKKTAKRLNPRRFSVRCHSYAGGYLTFEGSLTRSEAEKVFRSCELKGYYPVIFDGRKKVK